VKRKLTEFLEASVDEFVLRIKMIRIFLRRRLVCLEAIKAVLSLKLRHEETRVKFEVMELMADLVCWVNIDVLLGIFRVQPVEDFMEYLEDLDNPELITRISKGFQRVLDTSEELSLMFLRAGIDSFLEKNSFQEF
jgi:hypothetical protein